MPKRREVRKPSGGGAASKGWLEGESEWANAQFRRILDASSERIAALEEGATKEEEGRILEEALSAVGALFEIAEGARGVEADPNPSYPLPIPASLGRKLAANGNALSSLVNLTEAQCRTKLKTTWAAIQSPPSRALAKYILSLPKVELQEFPSADGRRGGADFALVFKDGERSILLRSLTPHEIPPNLGFPFRKFSEVTEFLRHFGGVTDFGWLEGSRFLMPSELEIMRDSDDGAGWGLVKPWDCSLVFYRGGTGDCLVLREDGRIGKWHHDLAMPGPPEEYANYIKTSWMKKLSESMPGLKRGPVGDLQCDFTQLAWSYLKYLKMPSESKAKQKSPFYY